MQCQRSAGIGFTSSSDNIKSHFVMKDNDGEATLKLSNCVEKCAVDSSKNGFPKEHWSAAHVDKCATSNKKVDRKHARCAANKLDQLI